MVSYFPEATASNFKPPPTGVHRSVCFQIVDIGTQLNEYQGQTSHRRQVIISWELADEMMEDDRPFTVSKFYTWSMSEKANLRKDLEAWRGVPFEPADLGIEGSFKPANLLGAPCLLNIIHSTKQNGDVRAKIASLSRLPKGMDKPTPRNPKLMFDLDDFDPVVFDGFSDKIKEMIAKSPEYQAIKNGGRKPPPQRDPLDDDVPF